MEPRGRGVQPRPSLRRGLPCARGSQYPSGRSKASRVCMAPDSTACLDRSRTCRRRSPPWSTR